MYINDYLDEFPSTQNDWLYKFFTNKLLQHKCTSYMSMQTCKYTQSYLPEHKQEGIAAGMACAKKMILL